ncbi:hypothetical protein ceV_039 [Chrysochromulina ericina virus CeV-01B]|uniref:Uncharacterized protein n=1 Tax=Chrysochromulina ericina virus CeV-01B TaxID=3070830 RepID=A0A0N7G7J3_9VIRU|nr:hypothetical protein ceV_039 [Chrysochromulina ericina virus]ALH22945.1 hypothetical protein ceV_039 [Chrysochromulina ericina virus CeV-01B]
MDNSLLEVIPWNASALELSSEIANDIGISHDFFTSNGEIIYGNDNTFAIDIKFKANQPGFVVQHIKKQIYDNDKKTIVEDIEYWEIFYISPNNRYIDPRDNSVYYLSENADSFKYGVEDDNSIIANGKYIQTGISEFYPYNNSDDAVKFRRGTMLSTSKLVEIFGDSVIFGNINTPANGLPYSSTKISVNGLMISEPKLKRIVTGEWNVHIDELVELKEEFQYLDPPEGIRKEPWSFKRFDYLTDMSDDERIQIAQKLQPYILDKSHRKLLISSDIVINEDIANKLFDYLTTAQFSVKPKKSKKTKKRNGGTKKYKKKSTKKSKKKIKRVKSRKKKI